MTPSPRLAPALLLCAASVWAGQARVALERVETSPTPVLSLPAAAAPLSPPLALNAASPALSPALAAPALVPPVLAAAPVAAAPVAAAPALTALHSAAAAPSRPAAPVGDAGAGLFDGRAATVDLAELAAETGARPLKAGVFIQQEQEGSLVAADPRDSSGSVFRYYRPVEMRADLVAAVEAGITGFSRVGVSLKRAFSPFRRDAYAAWDAWPLSAKLNYLSALEDAVKSERGEAAAWKGKTFLLMEKSPAAPDFLAAHPDMEAPPPGYEGMPGSRFIQPEVVSAKDRPAATVGEALARTARVIADTGHAGTQYHVFVKLKPEDLRAQLPGLTAALQAFNDALFASAARESFQNLSHPSLQPWHAGRSRRVAALVAAAANEPNQPRADDPDSEKHAFVGLRYWGTEDDKLVVSLELRGTSIPWKSKRPAVRDFEAAEAPKRDYSSARRWLALIAAYGERLAAGRAPNAASVPVVLSAAEADARLARRAAARGLPRDAYYGLDGLAKSLQGREASPPGLVYPFVASPEGSAEWNALADAWLRVSARARALDAGEEGGAAGSRRALEYELWGAYSDWARVFEAKAEARLRALLAW